MKTIIEQFTPTNTTRQETNIVQSFGQLKLNQTKPNLGGKPFSVRGKPLDKLIRIFIMRNKSIQSFISYSSSKLRLNTRGNTSLGYNNPTSKEIQLARNLSLTLKILVFQESREELSGNILPFFSWLSIEDCKMKWKWVYLWLNHDDDKRHAGKKKPLRQRRLI